MPVMHAPPPPMPYGPSSSRPQGSTAAPAIAQLQQHEHQQRQHQHSASTSVAQPRVSLWVGSATVLGQHLLRTSCCLQDRAGHGYAGGVMVMQDRAGLASPGRQRKDDYQGPNRANCYHMCHPVLPHGHCSSTKPQRCPPAPSHNYMFIQLHSYLVT